MPVTPARLWIVVGHFTPTDDDPDPTVQGKLDNGVAVRVCGSEDDAQHELLWYQDGIIVPVDIEFRRAQ